MMKYMISVKFSTQQDRKFWEASSFKNDGEFFYLYADENQTKISGFIRLDKIDFLEIQELENGQPDRQ